LNIADLDLNLLVVFDAMLLHQSVTRAGQALDLSQPAMSAALAKMRSQLGDPLFVRTGHGMRPTPRALQLAAPVKKILEMVRLDVLQQPAFDPATARRVFTVITPDIGETVFMPQDPGLCPGPRAAHRRALGGDFVGRRRRGAGAGPGRPGHRLFPGPGQARLLPAAAIQEQLRLHGARRPSAHRRHLTVDDFMNESHALVRPAGRTHLFEQFLNAKNIKLDVRAELSHFASLLTIISSSDLIATVPRDIGHVFATLARVGCWIRRSSRLPSI
jgi:DNA-binding transcriptional LysR family regulator